MENQINKDIGDEIICKLKELIEILEKRRNCTQKNEQNN